MAGSLPGYVQEVLQEDESRGEGSGLGVQGLCARGVLISELQYQFIYLLVAEWIHFTLVGIILPTIKPALYTFWGL